MPVGAQCVDVGEASRRLALGQSDHSAGLGGDRFVDHVSVEGDRGDTARFSVLVGSQESVGALDFFGGRRERVVRDRYLCGVDAKLSAVPDLAGLLTLAATALVVGEVGGDHVQYWDLGQTGSQRNLRAGEGDLVVRRGADTAHVSNEVFGAEISRSDSRVSEEHSGVCHAKPGLYAANDGNIESTSL